MHHIIGVQGHQRTTPQHVSDNQTVDIFSHNKKSEVKDRRSVLSSCELKETFASLSVHVHCFSFSTFWFLSDYKNFWSSSRSVCILWCSAGSKPRKHSQHHYSTRSCLSCSYKAGWRQATSCWTFHPNFMEMETHWTRQLKFLSLEVSPSGLTQL